MAGASEQCCDLFISEPGRHYISACLSEMFKTRLLVEDSVAASV